MRLLRYSAALLSVALVACPAPEDDGNPFQTTTTTLPMTTTTPTPDPTTMSEEESTTTGSAETSTGPAEGTTTMGGDSTTASAEGSECTVGQSCGNGCIEGSEECDCGGEFCTPAGLGGNMCFGLSQVLPSGETRYYTGGILNCNPASCQFDFLQCTFCGDENLNGMELCEFGDTGPSCQALGMGSGTDPLPCAANCLEWDTTCCANPPPPECN